MEQKVFGYFVEKNGIGLAVALANTGDTIIVLPSTDMQAPNLLGMDGVSEKNHDKYSDYFGNKNWEFEFINSLNQKTNEPFQEALEKERKRFDIEFENVKIRLQNKNPDDEARMRERSGV